MQRGAASSRLVRCALALALALVGVPAAAFASSQLSTRVTSVEASSLSDGVLVAEVYASEDGDETVEVCFSVTGSGTCAVGQGNTSSGTSFAVDADYDGTIIIPEEVSYEGVAYTVEAIENYAFGSTSSSCALTGVTIPATVQEVGSSAFRSCSALASLVFDFDEQNPSCLETIGSFAFYKCSSLVSVTFPASLVTLGSGSFKDCTALEEVEFDDIENSQLTYLAGTSSGTSTVGGGTFYCTSGEGSLTSITLPAGVQSVPPETFANQTQLESVTFLGDSLNFIGSRAFYNCSSLTEFVVPELGGYSGTWQFCLWDEAFYGCDALETLVFLGDGSGVGYKSYSEVFGDTPSLQTVVYWDVEYQGNAESQGGSSTDSKTRVFGDEVDYYFNVSFYETAEDAEDDADEIASVRISEDVTVEELRAALAGEAELAEDAIFSGCGDTGALPEADEDETVYWAFEPGFVDSSYLDASTYAWCDIDDDDGAIDMAACRISLNVTAYTTAGSTVDVSGSYTITAPDGGAIDESAYTVYAVGSYTTGSGAGETTVTTTYTDITALSDEGDYQLYFEAVEGGGYTGYTWASFTITETTLSVTSYPGSSRYAYAFATAAYEEGAYKNAIVVSEGDAYAATAAAWLSALLDAPVLVLPEGEVPDTNSSNYMLAALNYLFGSSQGTVYVIGDEDAVSAEAYAALGKTNNSAKTQRLSYSGVSSPARLYRALASSYETGTTAYVVAGDDLSCAAAAITLAGADGCPVFFCDADGTLDSYTRFVLKTGHFDEVVLVGGDDAAAAAVGDQVGDDAEYSTLSGTAQELALQAADDYYAAHGDDEGMTAIFASTEADDAAYAAMAAAAARLTDSALFLFDSESDLEEAIPADYLAEDVAVRTETLLFAGNASYFAAAQEYLIGLWSNGGDDDE